MASIQIWYAHYCGNDDITTRILYATVVVYRKVWLITLGGKETCAYLTICVESEILAPPTASTFERSIIKLASYEYSDSWNKICNSSWEYDQKPSLEENRGKIADFFGETRFEVKIKSPNPSQWNIAVLSIADIVQLAIQK